MVTGKRDIEYSTRIITLREELLSIHNIECRNEPAFLDVGRCLGPVIGEMRIPTTHQSRLPWLLLIADQGNCMPTEMVDLLAGVHILSKKPYLPRI